MTLKSLSDVRAWFDRVNAILTVLHEAEARMAECRVRIEQAEHMQVKRLVLRWQSELEFAEAQADGMLERLYRLTKQHQREAASDVLLAVQVRMEAAINLKEEWHRAVAAREHCVYASVLEDNPDDAIPHIKEAEEQVATAEDVYQRGLRLLLSAIPEETA